MSKKKKKGKKSTKTVSQRQLEANRQNAQLSTGPQTQEGKDISSRNATTHGAYAAKRLLNWEDPDEFDEFYDIVFEYLEPDNPLEVQYVDDYIWGCWCLDRLKVFEARLYDEMAEDSARELLRELHKLTIVKMRIERSRDKALKNFTESRTRTIAVEQGKHNGRRTQADFMAEVKAFCKPPEMTVEEMMEMTKERQAQNRYDEGHLPPTEANQMGSFQQTPPTQGLQSDNPPPGEPQNPESSG